METKEFTEEFTRLQKIFHFNNWTDKKEVLWEKIRDYEDGSFSQVVDHLIETADRVTSVAQILKCFENKALIKQEETSFCTKCGNSGWVTFETRLDPYAKTAASGIYRATAVCDCNCRKALTLRRNQEYTTLGEVRSQYKDLIIKSRENPKQVFAQAVSDRERCRSMADLCRSQGNQMRLDDEETRKNESSPAPDDDWAEYSRRKRMNNAELDENASREIANDLNI
jgi:hypothetical protein